jgi:hypothetical protein
VDTEPERIELPQDTNETYTITSNLAPLPMSPLRNSSVVPPPPPPPPPPLFTAASTSLRLLVHCPNYWTGYGDNRDAFLPNPAATSPREIQMFEFLGKLMGIAIRTKEVVVDIDFPPLIWKALLCIKLDRSDLAVRPTQT